MRFSGDTIGPQAVEELVLRRLEPIGPKSARVCSSKASFHPGRGTLAEASKKRPRSASLDGLHEALGAAGAARARGEGPGKPAGRQSVACAAQAEAVAAARTSRPGRSGRAADAPLLAVAQVAWLLHVLALLWFFSRAARYLAAVCE